MDFVMRQKRPTNGLVNPFWSLFSLSVRKWIQCENWLLYSDRLIDCIVCFHLITYGRI